VTVLNGEGEFLTPSAVLCDQNEVVVGRQAVRASALEPDAYAECFKRDIGGDVYHRKIRGVDVPPEVLSAFDPGTSQDGCRETLGADPPSCDHRPGVLR